MPNSRMSTWRVILKPVAFAMHCGWYSIHHIIIGHGSEAMARYPGRAGLLHDAIFALLAVVVAGVCRRHNYCIIALHLKPESPCATHEQT